MTAPVPTAIGLPALDQLAYSLEPAPAPDITPAAPARYPWRWVIDRAALFAFLAGLTAAGIVVVATVRPAAITEPGPAPRPDVATSTAPPPDAPGPEIPRPVIGPDAGALLSGEPLYLSLVSVGVAGHGWHVEDPASAVAQGYAACRYIDAGHTKAEAIAELIAETPGSIDRATARALADVTVGAAIRAFCPDVLGHP